jgi:hypothetical protein
MERLAVSLIAAACAMGVSFLWAPVAAAETQDSRVTPANVSVRGVEAKPTAAASPNGYYIEFRVAQIGTYGHSYVAYGRLNARGQPADYHYADLHPMGNYAVMMLGHVLPVRANTEWDPDVLKLPIASSYRRNLNAAEYRKLLAALQRAHANKQRTWNAVSNNCNHFVAELAKAVGLRAPNDFQLSYMFVPALRELNEPGSSAAKTSKGNRTPASAEQQPRT